MNAVEIIGAVGGAVGSVGFGIALGHARAVLVAKFEKDSKESASRAEAAKVAGREETARHRVGTHAIERALDAEKLEHGECREALEAARAAVASVNETASDVRVELAECRRDRSYQQRVNEWMRARLDKLDGGSIPPPPLTLDDMETEA